MAILLETLTQQHLPKGNRSPRLLKFNKKNLTRRCQPQKEPEQNIVYINMTDWKRKCCSSVRI